MRRFGNGGNTKTLFRFVFRPSSKHREDCCSYAISLFSLKVTIRSALCYWISLMAPVPLCSLPECSKRRKNAKRADISQIVEGEIFLLGPIRIGKSDTLRLFPAGGCYIFRQRRQGGVLTQGNSQESG